MMEKMFPSQKRVSHKRRPECNATPKKKKDTGTSGLMALAAA
jgi:hypothetical protein